MSERAATDSPLPEPRQQPRSDSRQDDSRQVVTRRKLVVGGLLLGGGALAGPGRGLLNVLPFLHTDPDPLERTAMRRHIGEGFKIRALDGSSATITLTAIEDLTNTPTIVSTEGQFSAIFESSAAGLDDEILTFDSGPFGRALIFLNELSEPNDTVHRYEAQFNRIEGVA